MTAQLSEAPALLWVCFTALALALLALDLGVFHRKAHAVSIRESLTWTGVWVAFALAFDAGLWYFAGLQKALEFTSGYLIEKALGVDNMIVFAMLFSFFATPSAYQHRVLFWGIVGALIMRLLLIALGTALITQFAWINYVFGALLLVAGLRMSWTRRTARVIERPRAMRWFMRVIPVTPEYSDGAFLARKNGRWLATPLLLLLLLVESADLLFATDSIMAVFAITKDPFIVYTANVFAVFGLRALYFALAGLMERLRYLKFGLGVLLMFIGLKMALAHTEWQIDTLTALGVVVSVLSASVVLSLRKQISPKPIRLRGEPADTAVP